jgi:hypothetical protein
VNDAVVNPAEMVTEGGTGAARFELESATTTPPGPAGSEMVTVPEALWPLSSTLGLIVSALSTVGGGFIVKPNPSVTPKYDAVNVMDAGELTVSGVTVKLPEVRVAGIDRAAGMLTSGSEVLRPMDAPATGAPVVSCKVHVATAGGLRDTGVHEKPSKAAGWRMVTVPPVAVEANGKASDEAAMGLET